jgi:2-alkenal reductase
MKRLAVVLVVGVLVIGAFYLGTMVVATRAGSSLNWQPAQQIAPVAPPADASASERQLADIYNRISPSVVSINVVSSVGSNEENGFDEGFAEGTGTGFVIDSSGHIVTNFHVVEGAVLIEVNFIDGTIVRGEIVGVDPDSDLAVLRVDLPAEQLRPVALGDSDALFIGQTTIAIGSPFNQPWTMTTGIISALDRTIRGLSLFSIGEVVQTDAAINPGNSGGPLLNLRGEVIGVNSQISSAVRANSGVGYAIPSNLVRRVAQALIEDGRVEYSYLGISGGDMTLLQMEALNLPNNLRGVIVQAVEPGSPADDGGLRNPGGVQEIDGIPVYTRADIIVAINGVPMSGMSSLISYLASTTQPGDTVTMTIVRDGREQLDLQIRLAERPN